MTAGISKAKKSATRAISPRMTSRTASPRGKKRFSQLTTGRVI